MISVHINIAPLIGKLHRLGITSTTALRPFITEQARLFVSSTGAFPGMVQLTPPHHGAVKSNSGRTMTKAARGSDAKKAGQGAIVRDLLGGKRNKGRSDSGSFKGIFTVVGDELLARARQSNGANVRLWVNSSGEVYGCDRQFFQPDASIGQMEQHHHQYFKNGRMTQAGGRTRDVGRWKFIDQMIVSRRAMDRYLKHVFKKVGTMASGLNAAAAMLGAKGVPAWITRHGNRFSGVSILSTDSSFYIVIDDRVPFGKFDFVRRARYALRSRDAAMEKNLPRLLARAVAEAGFARAA